jgi:plastocyanin domain-containing protein
MRVAISRIVTFLGVTLALSACNKAAPQAGAESDVPSSSGPITIIADSNGFTPSEVKVSKGKEAKLHFQRKTDDTCATDVVFPELNIKKPLPLNQVVEITLPPSGERRYTFTCGMGMYKSSVIVN